ncbi:MAG: hypothetical protein ACKVP0_09110 [Pirellulaceae bacterium]
MSNLFVFRGNISGSSKYLSIPGWQLVEIVAVDTNPRRKDGSSYEGTKLTCRVASGSHAGAQTDVVLFPPTVLNPNGEEAALIDAVLIAVGAVDPTQPTNKPVDPHSLVGALLWVEFSPVPGKRYLKAVRFAKWEGEDGSGAVIHQPQLPGGPNPELAAPQPTIPLASAPVTPPFVTTGWPMRTPMAEMPQPPYAWPQPLPPPPQMWPSSPPPQGPTSPR